MRKPSDKATAEAGVLLVERWILAVPHNCTFFSLQELNRDITRHLERLNDTVVPPSVTNLAFSPDGLRDT